MSEKSEDVSSKDIKPTSNGPLHVLMAMTPSEQHLLNPRVKRDFITKRALAFRINKNPKSVWANVNTVERSLVQCCEIPEEMSEDALLGPEPFVSGRTGCGHFPLLGGGALRKDKEILFLGIIAKDCRTLSSRSLALAILERTLQTHFFEVEEEEEAKQLQAEKAAKEKQSEEEGESSEEEEEAIEVEAEENEDDDEEEAQVGRKRRRSTRISKRGPKYKRTKRKVEKTEDEEKSGQFAEKQQTDYEKIGRLQQFFAGGGLKVLKRWLEDALEDEIVTKKSSNELTLQTSSTRSLILPVCKFLEQIPFDKNLVVESKINKQIRRIDKEIDNLLTAHANNEHDQDDLKGWTPESTAGDATGLMAVKEAVKSLKKTWQVNAKQKGEGFEDPFKTLIEVLRERLGPVSEFEAGTGPRPEWMVNQEDISKKPKKSRVELAAKERMMEVKIENERTDARRKELEEARRKHSEYVKKLREKMQKVNNTALEKKTSSKRIKWKDGLISKEYRDRKTLEEVFVFNNLTPANKDLNEVVQAAEHSSNNAQGAANAGTDDQAGEDVETENDAIDLTLE